MPPALDPRFAQIVAMAHSTTFDGEKANAWALAEKFARQAGMTLAEALAHIAGTARRDEPPKQQKYTDERDWRTYAQQKHPDIVYAHPYFRDRCSIAHLERRRRVLDRYGSYEAALAPCQRERRLLSALQIYVVKQKKANHRWTKRIIGWDPSVSLTPLLHKAVEAAYPMPCSFKQALSEHKYWEDRDADIAALVGCAFGKGLDSVAQIRADAIRSTLFWTVPAHSIDEVMSRIRIWNQEGVQDLKESDKTLRRDLERLTRPSQATAQPSLKKQSRSATADGVRALLRAHIDWSDRSIARELGCSPSTVGKFREEMRKADLS